MPRKALHHVTDPAIWQTLVAPVRLEILEALRMLAPCGIAAVAQQLDRPADSLYRHFAKLVKTGIVLKTATRHTGRRSEQIYDLVADDVTCRFTRKRDAAAGQAVLSTAQAILKMTERTFRAAEAAGQLAPLDRDSASDVRAFFEHAWLTPRDLNRLQHHFHEIKQLLDDKTRKPDGQLCLVSVFMAPIVRKRGAARSSRSTDSSAATRRPPRAARSKHSR
jgi:DNA-binding transcriptional ArsR family regulator